MNTEGMTSDERLEYWEMVKKDFESSNKTKAECGKDNYNQPLPENTLVTDEPDQDKNSFWKRK